mgnify:CR=1 FL=1
MAVRNRIVMFGLPAIAAVAITAAVTSISRSNATAPRTTAAAPASAPSFGGSAGVPMGQVVAGLGVIEPASREVAISAIVPGIVSEVRVVSGAMVRAGDILFAIDDRLADATVAQRHADLAASEERLRLAQARLPLLRADVQAAERAVATAEAERDEAAELARIGARLVDGATIAERELNRRRNLERVAESRLGEARARLDRSRADLALSDPSLGGEALNVEAAVVAQARAALQAARTEFERTRVRAPTDGTVLAVDVQPGEFTALGSATPAIRFGDVTTLHVRVDVDEADIPRWTPAAVARAIRRGAPASPVELRFVKAEPIVQPKRSLAGGASERVDTRVLQLVYAIVDTPGSGLRPGQVVDVFMTTPAQAMAGR